MQGAASRWESELHDDVDRQFILNGVRNGFDIVDCDVPIPTKPIICNNYKSASKTNCVKAEQQIKIELDAGNYIIPVVTPDYVSALGAIPKANSKDIRLIHDLGRPNGGVLPDGGTGHI